MANSNDIMRAIGQLEGKVQAIDDRTRDMSGTINSIDERMRNVEIKAASNGAISGGLVSILVVLIKSLVFPGAGGGTGA